MPRRRSFASALAIDSLLWQALAALLPAPAAADGVAAPVLICTAEGLVALEAPGDHPPPAAALDCLCCLTGGCSPSLLKLAWTTSPFNRDRIGRTGIAQNRRPARIALARSWQARAPPCLG